LLKVWNAIEAPADRRQTTRHILTLRASGRSDVKAATDDPATSRIVIKRPHSRDSNTDDARLNSGRRKYPCGYATWAKLLDQLAVFRGLDVRLAGVR